MHDYVKLHSVSFSEIDVLWFVMQGWMFLYRGIIFLNSSSDACFIDWHASLLERMWSLVIGQQATSQFEVIFSNSSQDFSCIIISFELCHSNTCLLLMKRYDAPMQIFNAACTEGPPPPPPNTLLPHINTWNTTVSFINYNKCDEIFGSLQEQGKACPVRLSLIGHLGWHSWWWQHSKLGWTASSL